MKLRTVDPARIVRTTVLLAVAGAAAAAVTGLGDGPSLAAGGAFMALNFHLLRWLVSQLIRPGAWQTLSVAILGAKLFLLLGVATLLLRAGLAPMSFAAGASLLLVAAVMDAAWLGRPVEGEATRAKDG